MERKGTRPAAEGNSPAGDLNRPAAASQDLPRTSERREVEVVAAYICEGGKFLICRRPPEKARGLLWEFVGGKVERGESKREALVRECREELDIGVSVGEVCFETTHVYPDLTVHLTLFRASIVEGTPKKLEHVDLRWIAPDEAANYAFCPADEPILKQIAARAF